MTSRTLSEIAKLCQAALEGDGSVPIHGLAALGEAEPGEISFLANPRYLPALETTRASAVLVGHAVTSARAGLALLRCDDPNRAWTDVIRAFHEDLPRPERGLHAAACIDPSAQIAPSASIGPNCAIGPRARIGENCVLHPGVVVGAEAEVGAGCELHPNAVLYPRVRLGARCVVHSGAVIGSDGFGFEPTRSGWAKIPQCGTVIIEDEVEIGANCTIDRARFGATRIGRGAKLDNLVHVAHNVQVGEGALLIAQVGIAGSARIGRGAIIAGQAGVNGHVEVGERARVGGQSGVTASVAGHADYMGTPARPRMEWLRMMGHLARIEGLISRVEALERRAGMRSSGHRGGPGGGPR